MNSRSIHDQYFGFQPAAGHAEGCLKRGTNDWEVTVGRVKRYVDQSEEVRIRLLCRTCGIVTFLEGGNGYEGTNVATIGYGSKPERCGDLWLHPGPILSRFGPATSAGPWSYYVTASARPPADESEVIGIIDQQFTKRHAIRWHASYGYRRGGGINREAGDLFASKRSAARWVIAQHEAARAAANDRSTEE